MHIPSGPVREEIVYRRILGTDWKLHNDTLIIEPAAFVPKPGTSLSVFLAAKVPSRRYVLQDHINKKLQKLQRPEVSEDEKRKIQRQLDQGNLTVEALYHEGWRIVEFPISVFPADVFTFEPPNGEDDGHLNVIGSDEDFQLCAVECVRVARMLTEEECLQG